jgi:hypothetical protein
MQSEKLFYAKSREGLDIPVIDLTNPRFAIPRGPNGYDAERDAFLNWERRRRRLPSFLMRLMLQRAAKSSKLMQALFQSEKGFLDSISTYILKLGAANLPQGYDGPVDRQVAASPHVLLIRLRMQQIASFLADALVPSLSDNSKAALHLINIAGGPALDSLNVLIFLNQTYPDLLKRRVKVTVLDAEDEGPAFGANALAAMQQTGAPLEGLDIQFSFQPYDWNDTKTLSNLLADSRSSGDIIAASSEGGLFEYGDDEAIVSNLKALAGANVSFVAGSVTGSNDIRKRMLSETKFKLYPRGSEGFAPLATLAGYDLAKTESNIISDQVLLEIRT